MTLASGRGTGSGVTGSPGRRPASRCRLVGRCQGRVEIADGRPEARHDQVRRDLGKGMQDESAPGQVWMGQGQGSVGSLRRADDQQIDVELAGCPTRASPAPGSQLEGLGNGEQDLWVAVARLE